MPNDAPDPPDSPWHIRATPAPPASANPYADLAQPAVTGPPQPVRREPELRSAQYSPSERVGNWAQDTLIAAGANPYTAGRLGRGIVNAASLFPPIGGILAGADTGYYAGSGDPLRGAASAIGVVPAAKMGQRIVSGVPRRALAPSEEALTEAKDAQYKAVEQSGVKYSPHIIDDIKNDITQTLINNGANEASAGKQFAALNTALKLKTQTGNTNADIETLRRQLRGGNTSTEIRAGQIASEALDNYMLSNRPVAHLRVGTPQNVAVDQQLLREARGNTAALKRSELVTGSGEAAELKAEFGKDFGDTLRQRVQTLQTTEAGQKKLKGFTDPEKKDMRGAVARSLMERVADPLASVSLNPLNQANLAAPGLAGGASWYTGMMDPVTAATAAASAQLTAAMTGRTMQGAVNNRMRQATERVAENVRMRSPLAQDPVRGYGYVSDPDVMAKDAAKYLGYPAARDAAEEYIDKESIPYHLR